MATTLFISDLHLSPERNQTTALFEQFLGHIKPDVERLYILGDLFDVWIGDDAVAPGYQDAVQALRKATDKGLPVHIMHGNRDFLLGSPFAAAAGCQFIDDSTVVDLYGTRTLLLHGDTLCTDDQAYQAFRAQVRSPSWQQQFLSRSEQERNNIARQLRADSRQHNQFKEDYLMDANDEAVKQALNDHNVTHMIHGHTHRLAVHPVTLAHGVGKRYVLGDWNTTGNVLICTGDNWQFDVVGWAQ